MKRIIKGPGTGKTRELLEYAQKTNSAVVCENPSAMLVKAHNYGIHGLHFLDYNTALDSCYENYQENKRRYVFDEIENFVKYHLMKQNIELNGYTLSNE